jgi:hypothetical protein
MEEQMIKILFDRSDMINKKCTYDDYYSQFVNEKMIKYVVSFIGKDRILNSKDKNFSDIPCRDYWDKLYIEPYLNKKLFKELNNVIYALESRNVFMFSLSDSICIAKQCARIYKERS